MCSDQGTKFSDSASVVSGNIDGSLHDECEPSVVSDKDDHGGISYAETKNVNRLKFVVGATTVISMVFISLAIFFLTRKVQITAFEDSYSEASNKVFDALGASIDLTLGTMDSFAATLVSLSHASNQTWPFVLVPDFAFRAGKVRALTRCAFLNIYPLVHDDERDQWENFTSQTSDWVHSDIDVMRTDPNYFGQSEGEYELWDVIHDNSEYDKDEQTIGTVGSERKDVYLPMWQQYPIAPYSFPPYNWDLDSGGDDSAAVAAFYQHHETILTPPYPLPNLADPDDVEADMYEAEWLSGFLRPGDNEFEPVADLYYPIYDISTEARLEPSMRSNSTFKGLLAFTIRWRELIVDILPQGDESVVVIVFESSCAPSFTYEIDGGNVNYLGRGDQHDLKYDEMGLSASLVELDQFATRARSYTGVPINEEYCPMTIRAYPTFQMEGHFVSKEPVYYALIAFSIFGLTALTFVMYSFFVERRQRIVLKAAIQSGQVVSNLFPSAVLDRVVQDVTVESKKTQNIFLANRVDCEKEDRPIADEYKDCTIMFMDIAGFTSWSARRTPEQVFLLLETLYGSFDKVARQLDVFKVETIGDSYMAATGVPKPTKRHASKMIRFASICRDLTRTQTRMLAEDLGPDTADLHLRIGINSGTVTAGVLRGDRSRFQLFGDTVNTASRMESTGVVDRIQLSETTADYLVKEGKGSWILARESLVQAKGKGELQTYFAESKTLSSGTKSVSFVDFDSGDDCEQTNPLVGWNFTMFSKTLAVFARRTVAPFDLSSSLADDASHVLPLSPFDQAIPPSSSRKIPDLVSTQLKDLIQAIACLHNPSNPFHNFEYASHVTLTFTRMWDEMSDRSILLRCPLTKLACMLGVLVLEIVHSGSSNSSLIEGGGDKTLIDHHQHTNIQQKIISKAWQLFMDGRYNDLRSFIFANQEEYDYFHQVFVNTVMATNTSNEKANQIFEKRWSEAFAPSDDCTTGSPCPLNGNNMNMTASALEASRRALQVELMAKVAYMGHTMQQWNIYLKWTKRAFRESLLKNDDKQFPVPNDDDDDTDPRARWLENEKRRFASTVIPLAQKIADAQFFTGSEDFLHCAQANECQLDKRAESIVQLFSD